MIYWTVQYKLVTSSGTIKDFQEVHRGEDLALQSALNLHERNQHTKDTKNIQVFRVEDGHGRHGNKEKSFLIKKYP